jgi:uncharacterized protein (TIGR02646 family)
MIQVNRNKVPIPDVLVKPGELGPVEMLNAIEHYKNAATKMTPFEKFQAYRHETVKAALKKLFNNKCAYCESEYAAVYAGDTEHFRPKGKVINKIPREDGKLKNDIVSANGYYWLAARWENLLLSCKDCNSARTQTLPDGTEKVIGKHEQFPIASEKFRVMEPDDAKLKIEEAKRMIINPCEEDPEYFFEYAEEEKKEGIIMEKTTLKKAEKEKARKSIDVYALQRKDLVEVRRKAFLDIISRLDSFDKFLKNYNDLPKEKRELPERKNDLKGERNKLLQLVQSDQRYAGMARQLIGRYLKLRFDIDIKKYIK